MCINKFGAYVLGLLVIKIAKEREGKNMIIIIANNNWIFEWIKCILGIVFFGELFSVVFFCSWKRRKINWNNWNNIFQVILEIVKINRNIKEEEAKIHVLIY